jgi:hypothetical protein
MEKMGMVPKQSAYFSAPDVSAFGAGFVKPFSGQPGNGLDGLVEAGGQQVGVVRTWLARVSTT